MNFLSSSSVIYFGIKHHLNRLETNQQPKKWVFLSKSAPKQINIVIEKNSQWWMLGKLIELGQRQFEEKLPNLMKKKVLFHQDNAIVHMWEVTMMKFLNWVMNCSLIRNILRIWPPVTTSYFQIRWNGAAKSHLVTTVIMSQTKHPFSALRKI